MSKALVYQVLPRLWKGGRFVDFDEASLAYIRSLGMTHVWYTGVLDHATRLPGYENASPECVKGTAGSPYSIRDYYGVAPYLGTMEEFSELVARTHAAGLKVIIDFVPNHVARENVNFGGCDDRSVHWAPENDFYYYPGEHLRLPSAGATHTEAVGTSAAGVATAAEASYDEFPARASGNCFSPAPDVNDWWDTVRLNYCDFHTGTWDKMLAVLRFWLAKGVDGFRCDMVEMVPWQFLQWLIAAVKAEFPSTLFIAEAYNTDTYRHYLETVGFDLLYDKCGLYDTLRAVTCEGASARGITRNWQMLQDLQPRMLNFLENHDEQRVASPQFAGSPEAGYAALAVSAMLTDAPFMLYFAQEWGEKGGADGRTSIFEIAPPAAMVLQVLQTDGGPGAKTAPNATSPPAARRTCNTFARYTETLRLAKALEGTPTYDLCWCQGEGFDNDRHLSFDPDRHFAWLRGSTLLVANFGDEHAEITVRIPKEARRVDSREPGNDVISVTVPPKDYVALDLQK